MVVMLYSNLNFRQATSQKLLIVTVFCVDTWFQSFLSLITCVIHHIVQTCLNNLMPHLFHILYLYLVYILLHHELGTVIYWI